MNRRVFLLSTLSLLLSNTALSKIKVGTAVDIYIDESGLKGTNGPLVFGALVLDSKYKNDCLDDIRKNTNYKPVLRYSCSNKYKKLLAIPFIDEFFNNESMSFSSIIIPSTINSSWPSDKVQRTSLYHHNYAEFIKKVSRKNIALNIFLERRTTTGADNYLKKFLEDSDSSISVRFLKEKESNCIQLSDLLTGSIYGELTNVKDKTKLEIIRKISKHLGEEKIAVDFSFKERKFWVKIAEQI